MAFVREAKVVEKLKNDGIDKKDLSAVDNLLDKLHPSDIAEVISNLPEKKRFELIALENFVNLNKLLDFSELAIDELVLTERFAWQLILNDGVTINLGRDNRVERIQRFMDIYPEIKLQKKEGQQVDYVDLRYDTGLAVGWKTANNKERV